MQRLVLLMVLVSGCGSRSFAPCDVREATCQQTLVTAIGERRGFVEVTPSIALRTPDEALAESTATVTDDERIAFARQRAIFAEFGLVEPGLSLDDVARRRIDNLISLYSAATKTVTIIDRGDALDSAGTTLTVVHELVHAMQDSDGFLDLALANTATTDRMMAHSAIIEGEATLYEVIASLDMQGWHPDDARIEGALVEVTRRYAGDAASTKSQLDEASDLFVYPFGHAFLRPLYDADGQPGIAAVYAALPDTTYEIMTRAKPTPRLETQAIAIRQPEDTTVIADSLGAFNVRGWCIVEGYVACEDIVDDAFTGILPADGSPTIGVWRIRFGNGVDPRVVADLQAAGYGVFVVEGDLVVTRDTIGRTPDPATFITGWRSLD